MIYRIYIGSLAIFASLLLWSCSGNGEYVKIHSAESGESVMTTADVRAIHQIKVTNGIQDGRIKPEYIICAEPSPDIAKAVADALKLSASADIKGLADKNPKLAADMSRERTEIVAQLTERLATIQLLRDTLYRACEAYANGAISASSYTVMLSRYDDIMITMLLGEFAAKGFDRSSATIAPEAQANNPLLIIAQGKSESSTDIKENLKKLQDDCNNLQKKLDEAKKPKANPDQAEKEPGKTKNPEAQLDQSVIKDLENKINTCKKEIDSKKDELIETLQSEEKIFAKVATVTGAREIPRTQNSEIAKTLALMQRKYLENINSDAIEVTCIETLFEKNEARKDLKDFCKVYLPESCEFKKEILRAIMKERQQEKMQVENKQRITNSVNEIKEYIEVMKNLIEKTNDFQSGRNDAGGSHQK